MQSHASGDSSKFLNLRSLSGLEGLRFSAKRRIEGAYSGRHIARKQGGAGEFADYREYSPGDDLRRLDWRILARTGKTFLKLHQDETNLACTMMIDSSGSMGFSGYQPKGDDSKLAWCQYFTTALSHLILTGRDHVGLSVSEQYTCPYFPPSCLPQQRGLIHESIAKMLPSGSTNLAKSLDSLFMQVKRRGVLMVLSDFLDSDLDPMLSSLRKFRSRGWEVIAMHIVHPDELTLPKGRAFRFLGMEGESPVAAQVNELREAYESRFERHQASVRTGLVSVGCDFHPIYTSTHYMDVLRQFLIKRSG
ncbi:MAG: DUF58 domain-containing protein [Pirellula sp.]|nr:DUF58 domain-containing protein [Pirellula sp.]